MSSAQEIPALLASPIEQVNPLNIPDELWSRMSTIRKERLYKTQQFIDIMRETAKIEINYSGSTMTLKFKSKSKTYTYVNEYINKYYTYESSLAVTKPNESYHKGMYKISFQVLPPWQPWEYIPEH